MMVYMGLGGSYILEGGKGQGVGGDELLEFGRLHGLVEVGKTAK